MNYEFYMQLALDYAWKHQCLAFSNPSVGALILDKFGKIIALEVHSKYGDCHAEVLACKRAYVELGGDRYIESLDDSVEIYEFLLSHHNGLFYDSVIFVTLEPCSHRGKTPSCAKLLSVLQPKEVVVCVRDENKVASGGIDILSSSGISVVSDVLATKGADLLLPFLEFQKKGVFNLYKLAIRLNGSIDGGVISSLDSRIYSHKLRNIADRIIISQKTLLMDNAKLDSRLVGGRAPDVCVVGKNENFHNSRGLSVFESANRSIEFYSSLESLPKNGFNIFEGGAEFFELCKDFVDCLLIFVSPNMKSGLQLYSSFSGRMLHGYSLGEDIVLWVAR